MSDYVGLGKQKRSVASLGTPVEQPKRQKTGEGSSAGGSGGDRVLTKEEEDALSKLAEFLFRSDSSDSKREPEKDYKLDDGEYKPTASMPLRTPWGRKSLRADGTIDWHLLLRGDANLDEADVEEGDSFWQRAHWANADFAKGIAEVEGLNPWEWHRHLSKGDRARAESQEGLSKTARNLLAEYERGRGGKGLRPEEFWEKLGEEDLFKLADLPLTSKVVSEGLLRDVEGGGIYLGVAFLKRRLKATYVGRTVSFASRLPSHLAAIFEDGGAGRSGTLFYDVLAGCDRLRFYRLWQPTPDMSREEASIITAILEGVFCQLFGSYVRKEGYLTNRRTYGLDNIGDDVLGCNATPCTEPPTALTTGQAIQNPEYVSAFVRVWFAHRRLRETMAETWDEEEVTLARVALREAHDDWIVVLQRLVKAGKLHFRNQRWQWREKTLIRQWLGCQPPQELVDALGSDDWLLQLEVGSESSVACLTEEDKCLFEGLAIRVTTLDGKKTRIWKFSKPDFKGAPRKLMTYMFGALSQEEQQRRRAALDRVLEAKAKRRRSIVNFNALADFSKTGVMGEHLMNERGLVVGVGSRTGARLTTSRIAEFRKLANIVGQGAVPIRFGIWGPSDLPLNQRNFDDAPSQWTVEILPRGSCNWIRLPFPLIASRKTSMASDRDDTGSKILWTMMQDIAEKCGGGGVGELAGGDVGEGSSSGSTASDAALNNLLQSRAALARDDRQKYAAVARKAREEDEEDSDEEEE